MNLNHPLPGPIHSSDAHLSELLLERFRARLSFERRQAENERRTLSEERCQRLGIQSILDEVAGPGILMERSNADVRFDLLRKKIKDIEDAIFRLEIGEYGICQRTGRPIPRHVLEACPWTRAVAQGT